MHIYFIFVKNDIPNDIQTADNLVLQIEYGKLKSCVEYHTFFGRYTFFSGRLLPQSSPEINNEHVSINIYIVYLRFTVFDKCMGRIHH